MLNHNKKTHLGHSELIVHSGRQKTLGSPMYSGSQTQWAPVSSQWAFTPHWQAGTDVGAVLVGGNFLVSLLLCFDTSIFTGIVN